MTAKKYKKLYNSSGGAKQSASASKAEEAKKNNADKQVIEQLQKLIGQKLKDPNMAKKAAQVISEMLNKK